MKILYVEDNEDNIYVLETRLRRHGHELVIARDGASGVRLAASELPDVILMDLSLPILDGWEATRQIKAAAPTRHIPVIALTANAMSGDRERCIEAGMDDYVSKPIEVAALVAAIARVNRQPAAGGTPPGAADPVPSTTAQNPGTAVSAKSAGLSFNRREALARAADDEELLAQIIDIYIEETPALITQLGEFLDKGDADRAFRAAHTIKGSSANLSAGAVGTAAREIELAARAGDLATARAGMAALTGSAAVLLAVLAAERAAVTHPELCGVPS